MNSIKVVQIVPGVPPTVCGIGDHAIRVGDLLSEQFTLEYLAVRPLGMGLQKNHHVLTTKSPKALVDTLEHVVGGKRAILLLHYSGYGYSRWSLCYWLLKGLTEFVEAHPDCRLMTMFHELWAEGPVWSTARWLKPLQKSIAIKLAGLSHLVHTNRFASRQLLTENARYNIECQCMPVFSNLGELREPPDWESRKRNMVLFRPPSLSSPEGERFWANWHRVATQLGIQVTIVAGAPAEVPLRSDIKQVGFVDEVVASRLLTSSRYAMLSYYPGYLAKSSILAAFAAHGIGCVSSHEWSSEADGLIEGQQYENAADLRSLTDERMKHCGKALFDWYQPHSIGKTADFYRRSIEILASSIGAR